MAAITSVSSNASPQRQTQVAKADPPSEPPKPSEAKSSLSAHKMPKRNDHGPHPPPNFSGVIHDARPQDPNVFFAGNGFAPQYFYDYAAAGYAEPPALPHLPWEEYTRFMNMNGADAQQAVFNGELGPIYYHAAPGYCYPSQPHFPFGAPSMGADGQLYGPPAFQFAGPMFSPVNQFIPQANTSDATNSSEAIPGLISGSENQKKGGPSTSGNGSSVSSNPIPSSNPSSSSFPRANNPGTVENSVKQTSDPKSDSNSLKSNHPQANQAPLNPQGRGSRDLRQMDPNRSMPLPRIVTPHGGFGRPDRAIPGNGFYDIRGGGRGWVPTMDKVKGRGRGNSPVPNGDLTHDISSEQNRGPRTIRCKSQHPGDGSPESTKSLRLPDTVSYSNYNNPNFPTSYAAAKFFVIKSYSEDDVHKSIKYNVWASTPNGNKRLDAAYREAISHKDVPCPVFLFFSVNASGQFCGVAEMTGPVDFNKSVDYWQQDKWNGQFKVKWHIIKDVPNGQFRHILLANNEGKPVTNSRDTQEVKLEQGLDILNIFKKYSAKTSILDDFQFYDNRQKAMQEKKAKALQQKQKLPMKQIISAAPVAERKESTAAVQKEPVKKDERPNQHANLKPNGLESENNYAINNSSKVLTSKNINSQATESNIKSELKLESNAEEQLSRTLANGLIISNGSVGA